MFQRLQKGTFLSVVHGKLLPVIPILLLLALSSCGQRAPAGDPLDEARRLRSQGQYEEALQMHVWLHDHVLEERPSYYGVRLSFALGEWLELAKEYPRALEVLKEIRDTKTERLLEGENDRELFHDVESINGYLEESEATVDLFKRIEAVRGGFAQSVFDVAVESLVAAEEYDLAGKYLGDPTARLEEASANFSRGMEHARSRPMQDTSRVWENIFTDDVLLILTVLDQTGDRDQAREVQAQALKVLDNQTIRNALKD